MCCGFTCSLWTCCLVGEVSLIPRLWPKPAYEYPLEATEDMVLVLLGGNGFDDIEYEEAVDAFELYRSGLDRPG